MRSYVLQLSLLALTLSSTASALRIPISQARQLSGTSVQRRSGSTNVSVARPSPTPSSNPSDPLDLSTVHDLIYLANVSIGGIDYIVQLDTGSSDLWVKGPSSSLPNVNQTSTTYNLTYGIGWAYGPIAYADVEFAGINIPKQALLDVSAAVNPALSYGASGILGLGFTSLSTIDALVNQTGESTGRSLLYNAFRDNLQEPNFITLALERSTDPSAEITGMFSIGEYDPAYAAVANATPISTWPVNSPSRWNVLLDAIIVNNKVTGVSTNVSGVPSNQAVILLDSGTSYTYAPTDICNAIYGGIPGAQYSADLGQWELPCSTEIDMALQFGNQIFPLHPLDVVPNSLSDPTTCVGSFIPQSVAIGAGQFDWLVGDNVLRSVYSLYDFGDFNDETGASTGDPYVKLLSIVDPDEASVQFHDVRGGTPNTNITYNASNATSIIGSSSSTITLPENLADTLKTIASFFPVMLAFLGLNALVLIILASVGICYFCKRREGSGSSKRSKKNKTSAALAPMGMRPLSPAVDAARTPPPAGETAYEPVSGTEDPAFTYPEPALRPQDSNTLRPFPSAAGADRPQSMMNPSFRPLSTVYPPARPLSGYQRMSSATDDTLFTPPRAGFREDGKLSSLTERPKSVSMSTHSGDSGLTPQGDPGLSPRRDSVVSQSRPSVTPPMSPASPTSMSIQENPFQGPVPTPEDEVFTPPRPRFASAGAAPERPQSMTIPLAYHRPSPPRPPVQVVPPTQEELLAPPRPGFHTDGNFLRPGGGPAGDRPRSIA